MSSFDALPWRTDLAPAPFGPATTVASLCHLSDLHVLDSASPMRFEWIETLAHDPRWRPLLHMHRPQESLVPWALAAHLDDVRTNPTGPTGTELDLVISTGDNIDNAQQNELDAYLTLMTGGDVSLSPVGGPQDADGWDGASPWPYWSPLQQISDSWKPRGYPVIDDFLERTSEPLRAAGLGLPWTSMPGNHDLLCQGTSFVNTALLRAATGTRKTLFPIPGFEPEDVLSMFVDSPEQFLGRGERLIPANPGRRGITLEDWIAAHADNGASGWSTAERTHRDVTGADAVVDLGEVVVIVLDTNHPYGDYQGSIGTYQIDWLDQLLTELDRDGRLAVLASHHGPTSLVNTRGDDPRRQGASPFLGMVERHPSVVLWLTGHRHIHRITPWPGRSGGFWEITTASIIDWPTEHRRIDVRRHPGGQVEIVTTVHSHDAAVGSLAWWHRELALRFSGSQVRGTTMAGTDGDRATRLALSR